MTSRYDIAPLDLAGLRTEPLGARPSKVRAGDLGRPPAGRGITDLLDALPNILAGAELRVLVRAVLAARAADKPVLLAMGAHPIKCGLTPLLADLISRGVVTGVAVNGACLVHDTEMALAGRTSEDVDAALPDGRFGVTEETGRLLAGATGAAAADGIGLGEAVGRALAAAPHRELSLLACAWERSVPVTAHVAVGTDVAHLHPALDPAALGAATHRDFRLFAALVARLDGGGAYLNLGSAVVMPEVFLKAVTLVRNLGRPLAGFTTANLDFIQHYRPLTNVVRRPVAGVGRGIALTGHHELLVPLLHAAIVAGLEGWQP